MLFSIFPRITMVGQLMTLKTSLTIIGSLTYKNFKSCTSFCGKSYHKPQSFFIPTKSFVRRMVVSPPKSSQFKNHETLIVTSDTKRVGISPLLIGMMETFQRQFDSVGYFIPIAHEDSKGGVSESTLLFVRELFGLGKDNIESMYGLTYSEAATMLQEDSIDDLVDRIVEKFLAYKRQKSFVLLDSCPRPNVTDGLGLANFSTLISTALSSPTLLIVNYSEYESRRQLQNAIQSFKRELERKKGIFVGTIVNKVPIEIIDSFSNEFSVWCNSLKIPFLASFPMDKTLASVRLNEAAQLLNAKFLFNTEASDVEISKVFVATANLSTMMNKVYECPVLPKSGPLIIASHDRLDLLTGLLYSRWSPKMASVSGIVLTCKEDSSPMMDRIMNEIPEKYINIPVLSVDCDSFTAASMLTNMKSEILPNSTLKIDSARTLWAKYVNSKELLSSVVGAISKQNMNPRLFIHNILETARSNMQRIVLPESTDLRILKAAERITRREICKVILVGDKEEIATISNQNTIDLAGVEIINPYKCDQLQKYATEYYKLRKFKGMTMEKALEDVTEVNHFGTMMIHCGDADGMVSGAIHTTADTIRPALQLIKCREGLSVVSSVFFMCLPDHVLVYGDCAINVNPTSKELAEIAVTSAESASAFGIEPRVAMLSYATGDSNSGPLIDKVREATKLAQEMDPDLCVDGPLQYDAAVDAGVASTKVKTKSKVAGNATILIFPDLNTGNNTYKAVQRASGAIAMGPLLQGLRKPINDLSRGCTVDDVFTTVAMTAVQSIFMKNQK